MITFDVRKNLSSEHGKMALDVTLEIENGGFIALTGPSGSGKTTLLRIIAGLLKPDSGSVAVDGVKWFDSEKNIFLHANKRDTGFVFQDYALFPNMTLRKNILYACNDPEVADSLIKFAGLEGVAGSRPDKLSGGQKQRCALLRAVSRRPRILLLDEPFASLDMGTKKLFQSELLRWKELLNMTVIMVSHDRGEVVRLADRIISLRKGAVESDIHHKTGCILHQSKLSTSQNSLSRDETFTSVRAS